jgi:hypothetical protein
MTSDDDVTDRILDGTPYDEAELTVRRTFPFHIASKIRVAVVILAVSGVLGPVLSRSTDRIRSFEGMQAVAGTDGPIVAVLALVGIAVTFAAGLLLVRQFHVVRQRSPSESEARRLVRTEELLMWFVIQGGAFVLIPVAMVVVGLVSATAADTLYRYGVAVYRHGGALGVGSGPVSALGAGLAAVLYGAYREVLRRSA